MLSPDQQRLVRIWDYCRFIQGTVSRFGGSWEAFSSDSDYQQSLAFSVLQIGELAGRLSDGLRQETAAEIDWPSIKGLRNIIVHEYGKVKLQVLWDIVSEDVPRLKEFCERHLPEDF